MTYTNTFVSNGVPMEYMIKDGIVRWTSNGRVPFADVLATLFKNLCITAIEMIESNKARELETLAFIEMYREMQKNAPVSDEHMSELRANFEPGTVVVDVITGRKVTV